MLLRPRLPSDCPPWLPGRLTKHWRCERGQGPPALLCSASGVSAPPPPRPSPPHRSRYPVSLCGEGSSSRTCSPRPLVTPLVTDSWGPPLGPLSPPPGSVQHLLRCLPHSAGPTAALRAGSSLRRGCDGSPRKEPVVCRARPAHFPSLGDCDLAWSVMYCRKRLPRMFWAVSHTLSSANRGPVSHPYPSFLGLEACLCN